MPDNIIATLDYVINCIISSCVSTFRLQVLTRTAFDCC